MLPLSEALLLRASAQRCTNGFSGTVGAVEIQTLFVSRNSRTASMPLSRPRPDRLVPPNGIVKLTARYVLMNTIPARKDFDSRTDRPMSLVHTPAASP